MMRCRGWGLSVEEVAATLAEDVAERQAYVTGALSTRLFREDCAMRDPTASAFEGAGSLRRYTAALRKLFVPGSARVTLLDVRVLDPRRFQLRVRARARAVAGDGGAAAVADAAAAAAAAAADADAAEQVAWEGKLNVPFEPCFEPYTSVITMTLDDDGLIKEHDVRTARPQAPVGRSIDSFRSLTRARPRRCTCRRRGRSRPRRCSTQWTSSARRRGRTTPQARRPSASSASSASPPSSSVTPLLAGG
eukprot:scaffold4009_cov230-Prasinococcus_capsulatus_cf.AAC.2